MAKVSVIIPSRKEKYLPETLEDLYERRVGQIEVIVVLDGDHPDYGELPEYPGLTVLHNKTVRGLRPCINQAVDVATGKFILKIDAHCSIGYEWDKILKSDCEDNWIVIPRRHWFDAPSWSIMTNPNLPYSVDAMSYLYPYKRPYSPRLTARPDRARAERDKDIPIAEEMGFQGSCWFMHRAHWHRIGGMDAEMYQTFGAEPHEIGLKTWLGPWDGKIMRNKKTWYAHWSKPQSYWRTDPMEAGRVPDEERLTSYRFNFDYWWFNRWAERVHDFQWLADKFWPLPGWPENWRWETTQFTRYEPELVRM
jgi:glycosyltransferase involved in cell wall biosynthesis